MRLKLVFILQLFYLFSIGQVTHLSTDYSKTIRGLHTNARDFNQHTSVMPFTFNQAKALIDVDSLNGTMRWKRDDILGGFLNPVTHTEKGQFEVLPAVGIGGGFGGVSGDTSNSYQGAMYQGGVTVRGSYGNKLSGSWTVLSRAEAYPHYMHTLQQNRGTVPGFERSNRIENGIAGTYLEGYLSYKPIKPITLNIGNGRNFIGQGYRSLLLSDYGANYPYLKITSRFWRIQYTNLYTKMIQFNDRGIAYDKYTVIHHISWNITKWWNLGLFESIVWQGRDSTYYRGFDMHYANPIMFYRPVEFGVGSSDNALIGAESSMRLGKVKLYGQVMLDEFLLDEVRADVQHRLNPSDTSIEWGWWANKYALQGGVQIREIFKGLSARLEFNTARPFMYSHGSPLQNYSHANLELAHPLGANFSEMIGELKYFNGRWTAQARLMYATVGRDTLGYFAGSDPFNSYINRSDTYYNFTGQGLQSKIITIMFEGAFLLSPKVDMRAFLRVLHRSETGGQQTSDNFVSLGITSGIGSRDWLR